MPPASRLAEQRAALLPILAQAFGELGYRRTTTAELGRRCGVRENILYRHWPDKVSMFVAALEYVHDLALETWTAVLDGAPEEGGGAHRLLEYEARHLGEFRNYRIIFSALGDLDQPEIRRALRRMYRSFHRVIRGAIDAARPRDTAPPADQAAWAVLGLGTMATILAELGEVGARRRAALINGVGRLLIDGSGR